MINHDPNNPDCPVLIEMQALIKFCEVTDNAELRAIVKRRLMYLSEITFEEVKDIEISEASVDKFKKKFNERAIKIIKDYWKGASLVELQNRYHVSAMVTSFWITKAFKLTEQQRLILLA